MRTLPLVAVVASLFAWASQSVAQPVNSIAVPAVQVVAGQSEVVVPIEATTAEPLTLVAIDLVFDPGACAQLGAQHLRRAGRTTVDPQEDGPACPTDGRVRLALLGPLGDTVVPAGSGTIAEWTFDVAPDAAGVFDLEIIVNQFRNGPTDVAAEVSPGRLTIVGSTTKTPGSPTPSPDAEPTSTPTPDLTQSPTPSAEEGSPTVTSNPVTPTPTSEQATPTEGTPASETVTPTQPSATTTPSEIPGSASPTAPGVTDTPTPPLEPHTPTPDSTITATAGPEPDGDANCDGRLSAADVSALVRWIAAGDLTSCPRADIDHSGGLDQRDLKRLLNTLFERRGEGVASGRDS